MPDHTSSSTGSTQNSERGSPNYSSNSDYEYYGNPSGNEEYWHPDDTNTINSDGSVTSSSNTNNTNYNSAPGSVPLIPSGYSPIITSPLDVVVTEGIQIADGEERNTGFVAPQYTDNYSTGDVEWNYTDGVFYADRSYSTIILGTSESSKYLLAENFVLNLPPGAVITGFEVEVDRDVVRGSLVSEESDLIYCYSKPDALYAAGFSGGSYGSVYQVVYSGTTLSDADVTSSTEIYDNGGSNNQEILSTIRRPHNGASNILLAHTYGYEVGFYPATGLYSSSDSGYTWSRVSDPLTTGFTGWGSWDTNWMSFAYDGSSVYMVAESNSNICKTSTDLSTWTTRTYPSDGKVYYANGRWYSVGDYVNSYGHVAKYSTDNGATWNNVTVSGSTTEWYHMAATDSSGNLWIIGETDSNNMTIWKCDSGTPTQFTNTKEFNNTDYNPGWYRYLWVDSSDNLYILTWNDTNSEYDTLISTDSGSTWTAYSCNTVFQNNTTQYLLLDVVYEGGYIWVATDNNELLRSSDGYTFELIVSGSSAIQPRGWYPIT